MLLATGVRSAILKTSRPSPEPRSTKMSDSHTARPPRASLRRERTRSISVLPYTCAPLPPCSSRLRRASSLS
eukprot:scaffold310250_cov32-Tisochrysis_lutea.AAC.1